MQCLEYRSVYAILDGKKSLTSSGTILPVDNSRMTSHSVVPDHHGAFLPLHATLQILGQSDVVVQKFEEVIALFLFEADDVSRELGVNIQGFLAGGGMGPDNRMNLDMLARMGWLFSG